MEKRKILIQLDSDVHPSVFDRVVAIDAGGDSVATACAERVGLAFRAPIAVETMELPLSASVGVAVEDGFTDDPIGLLRNADIALYRAKEQGRGQTVVFDSELREAILIRRRLQSDLIDATETGEIFLVYQPIVAIGPGSLVGFEALVRWNHPALGPISPVRFIPIAEETGNILPLGRFVLERAAKTASAWNKRFQPKKPLTINVNLSPRQMWDESYVSETLDFLAQDKDRLIKIEVTEGMTMGNPDQALGLLRRFSDIGVPLCIDDFGTGYSSLSYLHRFPFDVLKIDRSFITNLPQSPDRKRLVRSIIQMAHDLGMLVVAEGIETEAELHCLRGFACDLGQGYLFARPLSEAAAETYVAEHCGFTANGR